MKRWRIILFFICILIFPAFSSMKLPDLPDFPDDELLLKEEFIPLEWKTISRDNKTHTSENQESEANLSLYRVLDGKNAHLSQTILRYSSEKGAQGTFKWLSTSYSLDPNVTTQLPTPEAVKKLSLRAEKWKLGCYLIDENWNGCRFVAKYSFYVIDFGGVLSGDGNEFLTEEQFIQMVIETDERAAMLVYDKKYDPKESNRGILTISSSIMKMIINWSM